MAASVVVDRPVTAIVIGCGNRGHVYATYALDFPDRLRIVGIAEPNPARRAYATARLRRNDDAVFHVFTDWRELAAVDGPKLADAVLITTQDREHTEVAVAMAERGYHMLLEKPMAPLRDECQRICAAVERQGPAFVFAIGHVLRYTPYSRLFHRLLHVDRVVGRPVNVQHIEPIGYAHAAHSYVRGAWRKESESSPLLLAKSCHDVDWIVWMMSPARCTAVSSLGTRRIFRREAKPAAAGAALRCLDCAHESACPYSAKRLYLDDGVPGMAKRSWVRKIADPEPDGTVSDAAVLEALRSGPYGRCVYECDNDVLDNQVVAMQFDSGATASFTCVAFSKDLCVRRTTVFGELGELQGDGQSTVVHYDFLTGRVTTYNADQLYPPPADIDPDSLLLAAHGGGDFHLIHNFVAAVAHGEPARVGCTVREALESHLLVFDAEQARRQANVQHPHPATFDW